MMAHDRPNLDVRSGNAAGAGSGRVATSADGPSAGGGAPEVVSQLRGRDSHHSVSLVGGQLRSRTTELPESSAVTPASAYLQANAGCPVTSSDTPQGVCLQVFGSTDHPHVSHQA
jgi:hypothetical protein